MNFNEHIYVPLRMNCSKSADPHFSSGAIISSNFSLSTALVYNLVPARVMTVPLISAVCLSLGLSSQC